MIDVRNPYTPGAGLTPKYIAGRAGLIASAQQSIEAVSSAYYARSVVYYGLRGVGKTVILNEIEKMADNWDMLYCHIEVMEKRSFVEALSTTCNGFVRTLSVRESLRSKAGKVLAIVKSFTLAWNPEDRTISGGFWGPVEEVATAGTGNLSNDFTELLVALGNFAQQAGTSIAFFIDEIQYAKPNELEALITALHRVNQLGLPMIFFCAGLPKILKTLGDTKSYAERLFAFIKVDSLTESDATEAIVHPASELGVSFTEDAVHRIVEITHGYPYFIQEFCSTVWKSCDEKKISLEDVNSNLPEYTKRLDDGFFQVRYDRCTKQEKAFILAMVQCGELPCTMANIASNMGKEPKSIGPIRAKLIDKGLIYATGHGEVDFTVPQFDEFIRRSHQEPA